MMFDREKLKEIIRDEQVESTEDFQELMRNMTKDVLEAIYDGEITDHLGYRKHELRASKDGNTRNGFTTKKVCSNLGQIELDVPRDRDSSFEPKAVKRRQRDISGIEANVISMYAKGMTTRDIKQHIYDIYGYEISHETASTITDTVMGHARDWQIRPLQPVYAVVFMDTMMVKMRSETLLSMPSLGST